ncbi:hypothetical protein ES702_06302 [subsurface metagenome]
MEIKTNDHCADIIFSDNNTVTLTWDELIELFELLDLVLSIAEDENTRDIHLAP